MEFNSGVVRSMLGNSRVSRDCDWLSCAPARVCGMPAGGEVEVLGLHRDLQQVEEVLAGCFQGREVLGEGRPRPS